MPFAPAGTTLPILKTWTPIHTWVVAWPRACTAAAIICFCSQIYITSFFWQGFLSLFKALFLSVLACKFLLISRLQVHGSIHLQLGIILLIFALSATFKPCLPLTSDICWLLCIGFISSFHYSLMICCASTGLSRLFHRRAHHFVHRFHLQVSVTAVMFLLCELAPAMSLSTNSTGDAATKKQQLPGPVAQLLLST